MYKKLIISTFIFLFLQSSLKAGLKEAYEAYDSENHKVAFEEFKSLAEIGHKVGQYNLGHMYLEGKGVKQNLVRSYAWIKFSETKSDEHSKLLNNISVHLDQKAKDEASQLIEVLKKKYSKESLKSKLKPILTKNVAQEDPNFSAPKPIEQKPPKYPRDAQYAGVEGWVTLKFKLNEEGRPLDVSVDDAFPLGVFEKASLRAIEDWRFELAGEPYSESLKYKFDFRLSRDNRKNKRLISELKESALAGEPSAQYYYAKLRPSVIIDNEFNPTEWYYESAMQGYAKAQYELADNLLYGKGCKQDTEKAINWLVNSASKNLGRSQFKLAKLLFKEGDAEKGAFWLEKAIKSNDQEVLFDIAVYIDTHDINGFSEKDTLQALAQVDLELMTNPTSYYELYAKTYAKLGDFENAVNYQKKSHKLYKRFGWVPEAKQEVLAEYEFQLNSSP